MRVDSGARPSAPRDATYCGVAGLSCQAGSVASDEAVLFIQPAGTLQDAAQSQTERSITPASSLSQLKSAQSRAFAGSGPRIRPCSVPNERARVQMWRQTLNDHGRVMWRGQVSGHMSCLASNPEPKPRSGQRRSVKQPLIAASVKILSVG